MAKKTKMNKDVKTTIVVIAFAVLLIAALAAIVFWFPKEQNRQEGQLQPSSEQPTEQPTEQPAEQPTEQPTEEAYVFPFEIPGFTLIGDAQPVEVDRQLSVLGVGRYSGPFFEDLTDDEVQDVLAIVVQNTSEDWVANAYLTLDCGEKTANFTVTSLPGQNCALLLEQERIIYSDDMTLSEPVCDYCSNDLTGKTMDFGGEFAVVPAESVLQLQNISGREISGDAVVYYKNYAMYDGKLLFLGGITYSYTFEGPIAANTAPQARPSHFSEQSSLILFMSYDS